MLNVARYTRHKPGFNSFPAQIVGEHRNIFDDLIKNFRSLISDNASRSKEEEVERVG